MSAQSSLSRKRKRESLTSSDSKGGIFCGRTGTPIWVSTGPAIQDIGPHCCRDLENRSVLSKTL